MTIIWVTGLPWSIDQKPLFNRPPCRYLAEEKPCSKDLQTKLYIFWAGRKAQMADTGLCCADNEIINSGHIVIHHNDVQPFRAILNSRTNTFSQYLQLRLPSSAVLATLSRRQQRWERERSRTRMEKPSELSEPDLLLLCQAIGCGIGWKEWRKYSYYWDVGLGVLDIPCILTMSSLVVAAAAVWISRDWENRQNRQLLCWLQQPAVLGSVRVCCCSRARRKQPRQGAGCSTCAEFLST